MSEQEALIKLRLEKVRLRASNMELLRALEAGADFVRELRENPMSQETYDTLMTWEETEARAALAKAR